MSIAEKLSLQHGKTTIDFSVRFSKRKTLGISVSPESDIEVVAPLGTEVASILRSVERKAKWIMKQIDENEKIRNSNNTGHYRSGQSIQFLGRSYMLKVIEVKNTEDEEVVKGQKVISLHIRDRNDTDRVSLFIDEWFRNEALYYISEKFESSWQRISKYGLDKPRFYLRKMEKRWGSCTPSGQIFLNPDIIKLPSHCIDYVIMHELCHLKHKNHSKEYYYFLDTVMPDWKVRYNALVEYESSVFS